MALIERHQKTTEVSYWEGQIPMSYIYTVGRGGEKFFNQMKEGKITGAKCSACNLIYVPPRIYCEKCFARLEDSYLDVSPKGKVHTFTVCHEKFDGSRKEESSIVAVIRLDGTDGGLVHYLGEVKPEEIVIGMPVEAVFKGAADRKGDLFDIQYFRPLNK
jgi:uncharacterized OB-fold protein